MHSPGAGVAAGDDTVNVVTEVVGITIGPAPAGSVEVPVGDELQEEEREIDG